MKIMITPGRGTGPTSVAAFDAALQAAGVLNYNLIHLSSVIPPCSTIVREQYVAPTDEYGHRLYVVMARRDESVEGAEAWAGIGWTQEKGDGRGLFVECTASTEEGVRKALHDSLCSMMKSRGREYGPIQCEISGMRCDGQPVCALVIAVYKSQGWDT
jgi:arginine decarboxylase